MRRHDMKEKLDKVSCAITNMDTGETHERPPFYFFPTGFELETFVKIENVESYIHPDNSRQVCIEALGLDGVGFVFRLSMNFDPETIDEEQIILSELPVETIVAVHGCYSVTSDTNDSIMLHNPSYAPVPAQYSVDDIREVFRVNDCSNRNRLV